MKLGRLIAVYILLMATLGCRTNEDVLPEVATIQIILDHNKPPLPVYFLEDTARRRIAFDVYFFNAKGAFVSPGVKPTFLVNGVPLTGNTYTFRQAGEFVFTARVGNRLSNNALTLRAGRAADEIGQLTIKSAVNFLNADSTSRLPVFYEIVGRRGAVLSQTDYSFPIQLTLNGVSQTQTEFVAVDRPGQYVLRASVWGKPSDAYSITARSRQAYPLRRLPVIFHILNRVDPNQLDPVQILKAVNQTYRATKPAADPNQADAFLEFVPATTDPEGQPLPIAGINRLPVDSPAQVDSAARLVSRTVHHWCPQHYINVFISLDWIRTYPPGWSYAYMPRSVGSGPLTCGQIESIEWTPNQIPAIFIYDLNSFVSLDHELGHFLGLPHTFDPGCSGQRLILDTPVHEQVRATANGVKYTCDKTPFVSDYVMDYYVPHQSFSYEQVEQMRAIVSGASYIPATASTVGGRRAVTPPGKRETGRIVSCERP